MKYYVCEEFDSTGIVKTAMVPKNQGRWRIYSHDIKENMFDLKYYNELGKHFGITANEMVRVPQGHSDKIIVVTKNVAGEGVVRMEREGAFDGAITNIKNIMLCTIEADCTPVYILDPIKKAIGMVHSGWRGTVNKIAINAIKLMQENYGTNKEDLMIHLGPAICGNCYEVGPELKDEFRKLLSKENVDKIFKNKQNVVGKYLLDVSEGLRLSLIDFGINEKQITRSKYCTYHDGVFNSWRLERDRTKQMLTTIMLI